MGSYSRIGFVLFVAGKMCQEEGENVERGCE